MSAAEMGSLVFAPSLVVFFMGALVGQGCVARPAVPSSASAPTLQAAQPAQAMVVGTIHKDHLVQPEYPLAVLGGALRAFEPDLVLVEIRPSAFEVGQYEDGPFEMTYVAHLAEQMGVQVVPIDWWKEAQVGAPTPKLTEADMERFLAEVTPLVAAMDLPPSFLQAHSDRATRAIVMYLNAQARFFGGNADWYERQAWFHRYTGQAIEASQAKRIMAFVGNQHRPELVMYLRSLGPTVRSPLELAAELSHTAKNDTAPKAVVDRWEAGVARMERRNEADTDPLRGKLSGKIAYFKDAIRLKGKCCKEREP
ncbi:MAG: hypothetical protein AAGJ19_02345 [Myxococcota bacterium]